MDSANLNIRTDKEVKHAAEQLFSKLGLNMTTAVNLFLRQAIRVNGIPFEISADELEIPNDETLAAMREGIRIAFDPDVKGYRDISELKSALLSDESADHFSTILYTPKETEPCPSVKS